MSGTLATSTITNAGNSKIVTNGTTASGIAISHAQIGSANLSTLTTAQLQALTAVSGLVYDTTSSSSALSYSANTEEPNQVLFKVVLDETIGNFSIGNIGLLDSSNTLYSITALEATATKVSSSASGPGNKKTYNIFVDFSNAANITNFTILTQTSSSIPEVANETVLPTPNSAPSDLYLVDQHTLYNQPALAARYGSKWYFTLLDTSTPELDGSISLPGMFDTSVNPGDAVYFNGTKFVLASTANSIQNPPVGIKGYWDYLYPNGSVFTNSAGTYTTGTEYYCSTTNTTGNVVTTNTGCQIGIGVSAKQILIDIPTINKEILGSLTVKSLSGSNSLTVPNSGRTTINTGLNISGGLSVTSGILASEGTSFNGNNGYSFINDAANDTGVFSPSDGVLQLYSNSVEIVNITSSSVEIKKPTTLDGDLTFSGYNGINFPDNVGIYSDPTGNGPGDLVIRTYNGSNNYAIFSNNGGLSLPGPLIANSSATFNQPATFNSNLYIPNASAGNEPVPISQADGRYAAIHGSSSQPFNASQFTAGGLNSTGNLFLKAAGAGQVYLESPSYTASVNENNSNYVEHYVAPATIAQAAVNLGQAQADFAAINGSSSQPFNVADAVSGNNAVNLGQFPSGLSKNGWKKYPDPNSPSGYFIEQWGTITTSASGPINFTFPIAFPTAFLTVIGILLTNEGGPMATQINTASATTSYIPVDAVDVSSSTSGSGGTSYEPVNMSIWVKGY